ncbi:hypothetical protein B0T20DRAFT_111450 [Sordaria brevicollis]|uniref:Uncharacterized protein n=1 Tax=Sordaria brevicollis TaxID=83679 RepID=A0AAE0NRH8_SORBR|nr:hypothetical protein B0T20DRAFT_111450 [Sordaria brevicollis]
MDDTADSNVSPNESSIDPSNGSSGDSSNEPPNVSPNDTSNTSQNTISNVSSVNPLSEPSNEPSNDTPNNPNHDPANDSSYDSSGASPDAPSNAPSNHLPNVAQQHSQETPRPGANRRERLISSLRAALREPRDPPHYSSYDGPGADCSEALRVLPCCGACFVDMDRPEIGGKQSEMLITVLYGLKDQLSYVGRIGPFPSFFRSPSSHFGYTVESAYTIVDDKWCLYHTHPPWRPRPSVTRDSWPFDIVPRYTAIAYHHDCYATFLHASSLSPELARERLWLASVARCPGPRPYYYKVTTPTIFDMSEVAIREVARAYGMPELAACPTELIKLIHEHCSPGAFLWRAILAYTLALELELLSEQPFTEIPLVDIIKWKRGDPLLPSDLKHVCPTDTADSVMRIIFDNRGIKEIQRLSHRPTFNGVWSDDLGYVVEDISTLREFTACAKDGFLCLRFPKFYKFELPMWDTPNPPSPSQTTRFTTERFGPPLSRYYPVHKGISTCHVVNFKSLTGLTFMFSRNTDLRAIFAHYNNDTGSWGSESTARCRKRSLCYLPIAPGDQILRMGIVEYENSRIWVRMRLAGDIILNMTTSDTIDLPRYRGYPDGRPPVVWSSPKPRALLYGQGCRLHETNIIFAAVHDVDDSEGTGAPLDKNQALDQSKTSPFQYPRLPVGLKLPTEAVMSYAALSDVSEARVYFLDEGAISKGTCLGIIFRYRNGGCRAVGHVWDLNSRAYSDPTHISIGSKGSCTTVDFLPVPHTDKHQGDDNAEKADTICSKYRPMRGTMFAYSSYDERRKMMQLHIEVTDEETYPGTATAEENEA